MNELPFLPTPKFQLASGIVIQVRKNKLLQSTKMTAPPNWCCNIGVCTKRQKLPRVPNIYFTLLHSTSNFAGCLKMLSQVIFLYDRTQFRVFIHVQDLKQINLSITHIHRFLHCDTRVWSCISPRLCSNSDFANCESTHLRHQALSTCFVHETQARTLIRQYLLDMPFYFLIFFKVALVLCFGFAAHINYVNGKECFVPFSSFRVQMHLQNNYCEVIFKIGH